MRARFLLLLLGIAATAGLTACGGGYGSSSNGNKLLPATSQLHASKVPSSSYQLIYTFKGTPDGAKPMSGLIAINGTMYGTTLNGSKNYCSQNCQNQCYLGCGTVYSVGPLGKEHVVYNLRGLFNPNSPDGSWPFAGLTVLNGVMYGTASSAGANSAGTVFRVTTSGTEKVLHNFAGGSDSQGPEGPLVELNGVLYGTTVFGGGSGCGGAGCGTVFAVTPAGKEHVVYAFQGGSDGEKLYAGLTVLNGKLYGATLFGGGSGCGGNGCGTIFQLTTSGHETVLYRFAGGTADGSWPNGLTAVNGVLYGTTEGAGTRNSGTFFSVTTSGTEKPLYNFQDIPDGNLPGANLIYHNGEFYGTTVGGGTAGQGSVFEVTPAGSEQVLYSFQSGSDGSAPQGPLYLLNNHLFGTTSTGGGTGCGGSGCGTIFKLAP